ncbi:MAG: hypothetical protein ABEJ81_02535 [Haloferacaceae archaeon]
MDPLQFIVPLDSLEAVRPVILYGLVFLALANMVTRYLAHQRNVDQAEEGGEEAITRYTPHVVTSFLLILNAFTFTILQSHGGIVVSVLVIGTLIADFFEFESRKVEARNGLTIEPPKSALAGSVLVLAYAGYQSLFFIIQPVWNAIV